MKKKLYSILIVEDEPVTAISLRTRLEILGHSILGVAATGEEAFGLIKSQHPDLVLLDVTLAGRASGVDVAKRLRKQMPKTKFAFLTAADIPQIRDEVSELNPVAIIPKPLTQNYTIELEDGVLTL